MVLGDEGGIYLHILITFVMIIMTGNYDAGFGVIYAMESIGWTKSERVRFLNPNMSRLLKRKGSVQASVIAMKEYF